MPNSEKDEALLYRGRNVNDMSKAELIDALRCMNALLAEEREQKKRDMALLSPKKTRWPFIRFFGG